MKKFLIASDEEIKSGYTTDVYFERTEKILKEKKMDKINVVAEITTGNLPEGKEWGVLTGVIEAIKLLEGHKINFYSMPEGSVFKSNDYYGIREPVAFIEGPYIEFCKLETPLLGFLCQSSGVSTKAAHIRIKAWKNLLIAFGARRMHPAISPMIDWASYIGGFDGVSTLKGASIIDSEPMGTMPHSLIIVFGSQVEAWKSFDEIMLEKVPRIMLVDTFWDEKFESLEAARLLKNKLYGIRLDTPSSRRGNMKEIIREVKWELKSRGYENVKIIVSGGVNEENIIDYIEAGANGFGVGTSVSNAPTIDFALDIVEVNGKPISKRGKFSGKKQVWRCMDCLIDIVKLWNEEMPKCPKCGKEMKIMLIKFIENGAILEKLPNAKEAREYVLKQLEIIRKNK